MKLIIETSVKISTFIQVVSNKKLQIELNNARSDFELLAKDWNDLANQKKVEKKKKKQMKIN